MKTDLSPRANGPHRSYPLASYLAVKASPRLEMFLLVLVIVPFWTIWGDQLRDLVGEMCR